MAPTSSAAALILLPLLLIAPAAALNITRILEDYPEFSTFSSLLNQTTIAKKINSRTTITVLAVDNGAAGGLSGMQTPLLEDILSVHVILDYYDQQKIQHINNKSVIVTTLFQSSGIANGRTGFLNISKNAGTIGFGSAAQGAGIAATLVKEVVTHPYNISVLQISGVIYPPGIDGVNPPPPPPPVAAAPAPAKAHAPSKAPAPAEVETPADAPEASSPAADAPAANSPADSPADAPSPAEADAADSPVAPADKEKDKKSAARSAAVGASLAGAVAMGVAFFASL